MKSGREWVSVDGWEAGVLFSDWKLTCQESKGTVVFLPKERKAIKKQENVIEKGHAKHILDLRQLWR